LAIKLEINQGYTTMHGQPTIKIVVIVYISIITSLPHRNVTNNDLRCT